MKSLNTKPTKTNNTAQPIPAWRPHLPAIIELLIATLDDECIPYIIKGNQIKVAYAFKFDVPVLLDQAVEEALGSQVDFNELMKIGKVVFI